MRRKNPNILKRNCSQIMMTVNHFKTEKNDNESDTFDIPYAIKTYIYLCIT